MEVGDKKWIIESDINAILQAKVKLMAHDIHEDERISQGKLIALKSPYLSG